MLKRFSITLIVLSSIVYGSAFFMGKYYGTGFFDEILIQINRLDAGFTRKEEVGQTKFLLKAILENEHPPAKWEQLVAHDRKSSHTELFYHYKVWIVKVGLNAEDIDASYPIFKAGQQNVSIINMRYGKGKPVVQFPFVRNKSGELVSGLFYPINEPPLSTDYNKDDSIDETDVILARKRHQRE